MGVAPDVPAPVYREHDLFTLAALPIHAGVHELDGDSEIHAHDFVEIAVVGGGSGVHVSAQGRIPLRRGTVIVLRPGAWHGFASCRRLVVANTCLSPVALGTDLAMLRDDPGLRELLGSAGNGRQGVFWTSISGRDADEAVTAIDVLGRRLADEPHQRVLLLGHLLTVLGRLARTPDSAPANRAPRRTPPHPAVSTVVARFQAAPAHPWTLEEAATLVHLDPAYLTRLFRRHLGLPPIAYLARVRAEKAAELLAGTSLPVARVGALVGWPDPTYFARRFRALVGLTPTDYRQRVAGYRQRAAGSAAPPATGKVGTVGPRVDAWTRSSLTSTRPV